MEHNTLVVGVNEGGRASGVQAEVSVQAEAARAAEHAAREVLRGRHAETRHTRFEAWRTPQTGRLRALGERIEPLFVRDSA